MLKAANSRRPRWAAHACYPCTVSIPLRPEDLRSYRDRPWGRIRAAKERHWADETRRRGASAGIAAGAALWVHMKRIDSAWPSEDDRAADLRHHVRMASMFRRLADAFGRH